MHRTFEAPAEIHLLPEITCFRRTEWQFQVEKIISTRMVTYAELLTPFFQHSVPRIGSLTIIFQRLKTISKRLKLIIQRRERNSW